LTCIHYVEYKECMFNILNPKNYLLAHREASEVSRGVHARQVDPTTVFDPMTCHSIDEVTMQLNNAARWYLTDLGYSKEVYEQPAAISLKTPGAEGSARMTLYAFDYLFADNKGHIALVEVICARATEEMAKKDPKRWVKSKRGTWKSPFIDDQLRALGMLHLLISDQMIYEACQHIQQHPEAYYRMQARSK